MQRLLCVRAFPICLCECVQLCMGVWKLFEGFPASRVSQAISPGRFDAEVKDIQERKCSITISPTELVGGCE